jgi:hypothetical protein
MIAGLLLAFQAATAAAAPPRPAADSFPHSAHRRLFTSCTNCHEGIVNGDSAVRLPAPASCNECHDGVLARRVAWTPRPPRATNLGFDHRRHDTRVSARGDSAVACMSCHARSDTARFMAAGAAPPERCLGCHVHQAPTHLAAACEQCHRPLSQATGLAASTIARFPKPPSHDTAFVWRHRETANGASCATCHTRESCALCHVNARSVPPIAALGSDMRMAALLRGRRVEYRVPPSHAAPAFLRAHGPLARDNPAACANCHTRSSCLTCHRQEERVAAVAALPERERGGAPGVDLAGMRPGDHTPAFERNHRAAAAGGDASCGRCHAASFCASCHDAPTPPGFHQLNFVQRHGQSAFTSDLECATCHQSEAFCRDCHRETGRTPPGGGAGRYHDGQALWTFAHGGAARRAIETCASCHQQQDCLQCHSAATGWKVNPHGRGFDRGMERRNPALCRRCHVSGTP